MWTLDICKCNITNTAKKGRKQNKEGNKDRRKEGERKGKGKKGKMIYLKSVNQNVRASPSASILKDHSGVFTIVCVLLLGDVLRQCSELSC